MSTEQDIQSIKKELDEVKGMLADKALARNGSRLHLLSRDELQDMANHAGQNVRGYLQTKGEQLNDARTYTEDSIRTRPITSAVAALASGLMLGYLFKSCSK